MEDKLVTIAEFESDLDAQMAKDALLAVGINAVIFGESIHGLLPTDGMLNVEVRVFEKDRDRAMKIISSDETSEGGGL